MGSHPTGAIWLEQNTQPFDIQYPDENKYFGGRY